MPWRPRQSTPPSGRRAHRWQGRASIAVAFADLVDFTRLGEAVEPEALEQLANRLATMARDVAAPPVRFVKAIGDAVMLVCPDPVLLLEAMLDLAGAAEADDDFPRLRVGMAFGDAVSRAGDWFGSPVNLASRVTGVARPGAMLVTEAARVAIGDADGFRVVVRRGAATQGHHRRYQTISGAALGPMTSATCRLHDARGRCCPGRTFA